MHTASPLAGRYRFLQQLAGGATAPVWLAEDLYRRLAVAVGAFPSQRISDVAPAVDLRHPHLASILQIICDVDSEELPAEFELAEGWCVATADWIPGETLYEAVLDRPLSTTIAVKYTARLAGAVTALHDGGAIHGAISSRAVIIKRKDGRKGPVLSQVTIPPDGSFCSPARIVGGTASQEDDTWALHVLLYNALTARRPFRAKARDALVRAIVGVRPLPLAAFGINDDDLQDIVDRGLRQEDSSSRVQKAADLEESLSVWLMTHGVDQRDSPIPDAPSALVYDSALITSLPPRNVVVPSMPPVASIANTESAPSVEVRSVPQPVQKSEPSPPPPSEPPPKKATPSWPEITIGEAVLTPIEGAAVGRWSDAATGTDGPAPEQPAAPARAAGMAEADLEAPLEEKSTKRQPDAPIEIDQTEGQPLGVGRVATVAPPLPADSDAPLAKTSRTGGASRGWMWILAALVGITLLATVVWAGFFNETPTTTPPPRTSASTPRHTPAPPKSTGAVTSAPKPVGESPAEITTCVAGFFPDNTFRRVQDLSFLCKQSNALAGIRLLRERLVVASRGTKTRGTNEWSRLGWHQIAVYAIMRRACCRHASLLKLPEAEPPCDPVDAAAEKLADATVAQSDVELRLLAFEKATLCAFRMNRRSYPYPNHPLSFGPRAFASFLERNELSRK